MMKLTTTFCAVLLSLSGAVAAQEAAPQPARTRQPAGGTSGAAPAEFAPSPYIVPVGMVPGGAFIDRIRPMPVERGMRSDVWGGENVRPRNATNGLEDPEWSYWCMSVVRGDDGKEHMFACRWPEKSPGGHKTWPRSEVVHAVADRPTGPFVVQHEIGPGHNVMCFRAKDGTYVLYVIGKAYVSKSLAGPWTPHKLSYDLRGTGPSKMTNLTFAQREDGSYLMVSREGHIWISEDGLKPFRKIVSRSVYPPIPGRFEDPVVWRDNVQYNLIVNDWFGRTAYYLRSTDGVTWVWDSGKAYDTDVVRHPDGTKEGWVKLERSNVRQDALGRATHLYFAAIDSQKSEDLGGDNHSSKIVALPLTVPRRVEILNEPPIGAATNEVRIAIRAEEDFDPTSTADIQSLRFGAPARVDFGRGSKAESFERQGRDLIVTFRGADAGLTKTDFVAKLLGKTATGELLLGYATMPGHAKLDSILVSREPKLSSMGDGGHSISLLVENFGQVESGPTPLKLVFRDKGQVTHSLTASIPAIVPYGNATVEAPVTAGRLKSHYDYELEVIINPDRPHSERYTIQP